MLELNHKRYVIYGAENKPVTINNPKETFLINNGKQNGATLHDVFKKIADTDEGEIDGWSLLEFYRPEEGYLVDNDGNKINFIEGENEIFFKKIKDPVVIFSEKEVNLEYVRMISSLLGLSTIEETITGLSNDEKTLLVEERMAENEKRQAQIRKERADADAAEKRRLQEEKERIEKEQAEEQERLDALEKERIAAEEKSKAEAEEQARLEAEAAEAARIKAEEEEKSAAEKAKLIAEAKAEARAEFEKELAERREREQEQAKAEAEAKAKAEAEARKERMAKRPENAFEEKGLKNLRKHYDANGYTEYTTEDGKYIFFHIENPGEDDEPFLVANREDYYQELEGELTVDVEKKAEFEFKDEGESRVIVLNKKTGTIKVQVNS